MNVQRKWTQVCFIILLHLFILMMMSYRIVKEDLEILLPVMDLMPVSADQDVSVQIPTVKQTKAKVVKF